MLHEQLWLLRERRISLSTEELWYTPDQLGDDCGEGHKGLRLLVLDPVEEEVVLPLPWVLLHQVLHLLHAGLQFSSPTAGKKSLHSHVSFLLFILRDCD